MFKWRVVGKAVEILSDPAGDGAALLFQGPSRSCSSLFVRTGAGEKGALWWRFVESVEETPVALGFEIVGDVCG